MRALAEILRQALQRGEVRPQAGLRQKFDALPEYLRLRLEVQRNAIEATAGQHLDVRDPREWQRLLARSTPNLEAVGATTNSSSAIALKEMPRLNRAVFLNEMARTLHALPQI